MKSRNCLQGTCLALLSLVCWSVAVWPIGVTAELSLIPAPIARGDTLMIGIVLDNAAGHSLEDVTLFVPLPVGIDQWKAEVRIDLGSWMVYPANGLIALPEIPASSQMAVDIRVPIEPASPATLTMIAQLLNATGILAQTDGWVNVLPSVDAGPDRIADLGTSISLEDSTASDGSDPVLSYAWTDHGAGGSFDDASLLRPTYTPPASSGIVELTLIVTDSDGGESSDSLRVRVNAIPKVDVGEDLEAQEGIRLPIRHVIVTDADGWIASMTWSDGGAGGTFLPSCTVIDPTYLIPDIDGCEDTDIMLTLEVIDDWGARDTDTMILHVVNVNGQPIVQVPESMEAVPGQRVELSGLAVDQDGWIDVQTWEQMDGMAVALHAGSEEGHVWFDVPDIDVVSELSFRFLAIDNCGAASWGDVLITIIPEPAMDETPLPDASLSVTIDLFDERGFPLTPFDTPRVGDVVTVRVSVVNTGQADIENLLATLTNDNAYSLTPNRLVSWGNTVGVFEWLVGSDELVGGLEIGAIVTGSDNSGRTVTASDAFRFLTISSDDTARIQLVKTTLTAEARVDETITYDYDITNIGSSDLVGLTLVDDKLGRIELPRTTLHIGDTLSVHAVYGVRSSDLPGPLENWARVTGFTQQGDPVEAEASASVEILALAGGGGAQSPVQGKVVISEIAWAGTSASSQAEWIELTNLGESSVDLTGWRISWYEKKGVVPPPSQWHFIELAGVIDPLPDAVEEDPGVDFVSQENGLWSVVDPRWPRPGASSGIFLLERASDRVVANVSAGLVYGDAVNPYYDLPDSGAAVFLIDPSGTAVDSANAQYAERLGWPAGNPITGATMERVNLWQGDFDGNWQTTSGVLTYGEDDAGHGLLATAGMPNSYALDTLLQIAAATLNPTLASLTESVPIPDTEATDRATIQMTALATSLSVGGGGGASQPPELNTLRTSQGLIIEMNLETAAAGSYFIWITLKNGRTMVLPIQK